MKKDTNLITEVENIYRISHSTTEGEFISEFHCHDSWEIFVYLEGSVTYYVEDKVYELILGDVLVIPPGKMHKAVLNKSSDQTYERIVLSLYSNYLNGLTATNDKLSNILRSFRHENNFLLSFKSENLTFVQGLLSRMNKQENDEELKLSMLKALIYILADSADKRSNEVGQYVDELISNVLQYINIHYTETLSLDKICAEFYVSKFYVNRRFKEYTGLTIYDYILTKRIGLARRLIRNGATANEAAERCGFGDYSTFYRTFTAKTGFTPKNFKNAPEQ